ncbi:MAG TPA: response regulator, partial [Nitrospira sp.]|nr:response regulator [Nitrospira sp.]
MNTSSSKKVLVVEDERDILQLVTLYLEKEGFRVLTATTGIEALKKVKDEKPDLLILDLMLPEMDGLEVCKRVRAMPDTAMLPIIMLTAKAEESDTIVGLELGADDYVTKPFS